jgi:hypothetical protein
MENTRMRTSKPSKPSSIMLARKMLALSADQEPSLVSVEASNAPAASTRTHLVSPSHVQPVFRCPLPADCDPENLFFSRRRLDATNREEGRRAVEQECETLGFTMQSSPARNTFPSGFLYCMNGFGRSSPKNHALSSWPVGHNIESGTRPKPNTEIVSSARLSCPPTNLSGRPVSRTSNCNE